MLAQSASGRILWGMAKHRVLAWVVLIEGSANLILSIVLVRRFGIVGDALGTAIPLTCTMLFFMPQHICRTLNIRVGTYLKQAFLLPLLLCAPMVAVLLSMRQWSYASNLWQLVLQLSIASLVYGAGLLWAIWTHRAWQVGDLSHEKQADELTVALVQSYQEES